MFGALIVRRHIYWEFFSFRLLFSLLDLLFTSLLLTIGYLPINGCTVLVDICIAGLLSILDFENHKEGLSFSIIVIPRADCIHMIVMRCINKVIIRLAVPCLSNYYNFVSSKFTRKNTIYYFQVACVICPEIRREIFSIVKLYIQFCEKSSFFTERNTQPYYLIHNEKWKFIVPLATPHRKNTEILHL